ncbi:2Fe-2S iron-sulfur cluster-binding protein [Thiovibrio frasassiensis]|jgi:Na+-transporting NADH:ubiquinone oxidoreductase subunit F|uniref:2Fe-2S iron-sulfur cluster-binding protein n=1 Tax=Thiovibrio frasassiensis TaxID=2984131 RepID=A0A9X4ME67_9BACT|nr:2Fe-2S iron-sulfur cluster-binding protein [Thiovibrio frasassiensis]MDG4474641.1 2Fe-2S iron-sulfur cluster-binding protein [Thiovibrio frasassiensis]
MPEISIVNRGVSVSVNPAFSLLNNYRMQNIPIQTLCGGKAMCGRCRFRVIAGAAHLSPVKPAEIARLGESLIAAGWRLSCQSHALRDVSIELPGLEEELDDRPRSTA